MLLFVFVVVSRSPETVSASTSTDALTCRSSSALPWFYSRSVVVLYDSVAVLCGSVVFLCGSVSVSSGAVREPRLALLRISSAQGNAQE